MPGATGSGGSPWPLLPQQLAALGLSRPVVLQLLALHGSSVSAWTRPGSPLRQRLLDAVAANTATGLKPDMVLWQQGEADSRVDTPAQRYTQGLQHLASLLPGAGVQAPILLALSTVCRSAPHSALRSAALALPQQDRRFAAGPDTDMVSDRSDGCHCGPLGRQQVASGWAAAIAPQLKQGPSTGAP